MQLRLTLLGILVARALGGCGDDTPYVPQDAPTGGGSGTFTAFVIDLVMNHSADPTPVAYSTFSALPDPGGDANNQAAYASLFQ
ncbi:MAG: hypothetical protein ABJE66_31805 [Deltaproteobacteria bacterium]